MHKEVHTVLVSYVKTFCKYDNIRPAVVPSQYVLTMRASLPTGTTTDYNENHSFPNSRKEDHPDQFSMASIIGLLRRNYTVFNPPTPAKSQDALRIGLLGASNIAYAHMIPRQELANTTAGH